MSTGFYTKMSVTKTISSSEAARFGITTSGISLYECGTCGFSMWLGDMHEDTPDVNTNSPYGYEFYNVEYSTSGSDFGHLPGCSGSNSNIDTTGGGDVGYHSMSYWGEDACNNGTVTEHVTTCNECGGTLRDYSDCSGCS